MPLFSLCEIDRSINRIEKSPPQTAAFIESWVLMLRFLSYQTHPQKSLSNKPWPHRSSRSSAKESPQRANLLSPLGTWSPKSLSPITEDDVSASSQGGQPETSTRHQRRGPTPPNVCWHEGGIGEAASSVRQRTRASEARLRKHGPWRRRWNA